MQVYIKGGKLKKIIGDWDSVKIESYINQHSGNYIPHNSMDRDKLEAKACSIKVKEVSC